MNFLDMMSGSVLGAPACNMDTFFMYFPAAETMYTIFIALGMGFLLPNIEIEWESIQPALMMDLECVLLDLYQKYAKIERRMRWAGITRQFLCSIADNPTLTNESKYQILEDTTGMPFKNITYAGKPVVPYFVTYHAALKSKPGRHDYCVEVNFDSYPEDKFINVYRYDFNPYNSSKEKFNRNKQLVPQDFHWETMRCKSGPIGSEDHSK